MDEVGVIAGHGRAVGHAGDIRDIALDLDASGAGKGFGKDESHQRGGDDDEQKDSQDDGLADADDAPIIQEVQFGFLWRGYF